MDDQPVHSDRDEFDEAAYLRLYPDIVKAIAEGREVGAWEHYDRHGRKEGPQINQGKLAIGRITERQADKLTLHQQPLRQRTASVNRR